MSSVKHLHRMDSDSKDILSTFFAAIVKVFPAFVVGMLAKVANDVRDGRKMKMLGWTAIVVMSLCATFLSNWICEVYGVSKNTTVVINAFSTLFSEQLFKIMFSNFFIFIQGWVKENLKFGLKSMDDSSSTHTPPTSNNQ